MRFILFIVFLAACAFALGHGVFGSEVVGALWVLIAVVAMGFRAVLDALQRIERGGQPAPDGGYSGGGGVKMPSWLEGSGGAGQK